MGIDSSGDVVDTVRQALVTGANNVGRTVIGVDVVVCLAAIIVVVDVVGEYTEVGEGATQTVGTTGVALGGTGGGLTQGELRDLTGGSNGTYTVVDDGQ